MYILSPKVNFLGGALVSASHLGRLFPGRLLVWKSESRFLDSNQVQYEVVPDPDQLHGDEIWCNDICTDVGYYPTVIAEQVELWNYLKSFKVIHLHNHQPISRVANYLDQMLTYLYTWGCNPTIYLWNYRACWNIEWDYYLSYRFPNIQVRTSPYHYYLDYLPNFNQIEKLSNLVYTIGRSSSKCKIQCKYDEIKTSLNYLKIFELDQLLPDNDLGNTAFLTKLCKAKYILTGYYYGGEGRLEFDQVFNKLEWSALDSLLIGSIPVTSTLFNSELDRLGLPLPTLGYKDFQGIEYLSNTLLGSPLRDESVRKEAVDRLVQEITYGNYLFSKILE